MTTAIPLLLEIEAIGDNLLQMANSLELGANPLVDEVGRLQKNIEELKAVIKEDHLAVMKTCGLTVGHELNSPPTGFFALPFFAGNDVSCRQEISEVTQIVEDAGRRIQEKVAQFTAVKRYVTKEIAGMTILDLDKAVE